MKKTIRDYQLLGKRVIIRCDFNVPIKNQIITDDTRIKESLATINYAINEGAKVILLSHLGRIKEEKDLTKNNLIQIAQHLSTLLNHKILFSTSTKGTILENAISAMSNGDVILVQNTRYEDLIGKKESSNESTLGQYWASLGEIFINDAFGTAHRSHASNVGIPSHLQSGVGFLIEKELIALEELKNPQKPFIVILGGSKVKDKIGVIKELVQKADLLLIGGGMAFTFLKAQGIEVGKSIVDIENINFCQELLETYPSKILLPIDVNVATEFTEESANHLIDIHNILPHELGMDLGPKTINMYKDLLTNAKTILWNGPLGVYEMKKYQVGTKELLSFITTLDAHVVLGGGDIVAASSELNYKSKVTHASTGGGATLEYLEGKLLPGIEVISERG